MNSKKIKPQFIKKTNPRVGLIVLATDVMIEKDFLKTLLIIFYTSRYMNTYHYMKFYNIWILYV